MKPGSDFQGELSSTLIHAFGLDHSKLTYNTASLTGDQGAKVVEQLLA